MDSLVKVRFSEVEVLNRSLLDPSEVEKHSKGSNLRLEKLIGKKNDDTVDLQFDKLYKSLTITAQQVLDKLNEILSKDLPAGIASLDPESTTSEATADRIVKGATAYFDVFAKQHPNLSGEDLLNKFMDTIRLGIDDGYEQATGTLEAIGAFQFSGVKDGVEETKRLIEEKLTAYEAYKREQLGLPVKEEEPVSKQVNAEVLKQAGSTVSLHV